MEEIELITKGGKYIDITLKYPQILIKLKRLKLAWIKLSSANTMLVLIYFYKKIYKQKRKLTENSKDKENEQNTYKIRPIKITF